MEVPTRSELMARLRALPASQPLLEHLSGEPGVYLVGGAVRDLLLGREPAELDLVVEGDPRGVADRLGGDAREHERFQTITVMAAGHRYDLARARSEHYVHSGALPEVEPATLAEDLLRRDFTVNAIAMALGAPDPGALRFAPGAWEDLENQHLRVLHEASFHDDPTRLLRLVRYASRLGFDAEPRTAELACAAIRGGALATVSGPRLGQELRLLAREPDPVAALDLLGHWGIDAALDPRLGLADAGLAGRALAILEERGRRDLLALALAARNVPGPELTGLLDRLGFEAGDREVIVATASTAERLAADLAGARLPSQIAAAIGGATPETVALAGALGPERQARQWLSELSQVRLEITGHDLLEAGVPPGPAVGAGLRAALAAKLDGAAPGRADQLGIAVEAAAGRG